MPILSFAFLCLLPFVSFRSHRRTVISCMTERLLFYCAQISALSSNISPKIHRSVSFSWFSSSFSLQLDYLNVLHWIEKKKHLENVKNTSNTSNWQTNVISDIIFVFIENSWNSIDSIDLSGLSKRNICLDFYCYYNGQMHNNRES